MLPDPFIPEVENSFINELVELRNRLSKKNKQIIKKIKKDNPWVKRNETIPKEIAEEFIRESAWWLTHSSGYIVPARRYADKIYESIHGWTVNFGSNKFLVGMAIERCVDALNDVFLESESGKIPSKENIEKILIKHISSSVAGSRNTIYTYPIKNSQLIFGAHAINVQNGVGYILKKINMSSLLL